jgi:peptidoglycan DL-endopeptidase CwlO
MNGDIPHLVGHIRELTARLQRLVPMLLKCGCASSPPPHSIPSPQFDPPTPLQTTQDRGWDGEGGSAGLRPRGEELADFALSLRGAPYRYGGATPGGFDCSGLVF